jgi:hypothetical protein
MPQPIETTLQDVIRAFSRSEQAWHKYNGWRSGDRPDEVVRVASAIRMQTVYTLTAADVEAVAAASDHALDDIKKASIVGIDAATNWSPDFAFTHAFGYLVERERRLPTWQAFERFVWEDREGLAMLGGPAARKRSELERVYGLRRARDAIRWRFGLAYYGFMRETHAVAVLRDAGVDVRVHPVADAIFKADGWTNDTVLGMRVPNQRFAEGDVGRKDTPQNLLSDTQPPFRFVTIELKPTNVFGKVWLADRESIRAQWFASDSGRPLQVALTAR